MRALIITINLAILALAGFMTAACVHDNVITRESVQRVEAAQLRQAAQIRQLQTDGEILTRIITTGEYIQE